MSNRPTSSPRRACCVPNADDSGHQLEDSAGFVKTEAPRSPLVSPVPANDNSSCRSLSLTCPQCRLPCGPHSTVPEEELRPPTCSGTKPAPSTPTSRASNYMTMSLSPSLIVDPHEDPDAHLNLAGPERRQKATKAKSALWRCETVRGAHWTGLSALVVAVFRSAPHARLGAHRSRDLQESRQVVQVSSDAGESAKLWARRANFRFESGTKS
jgi:hypothetical protein